MTENQGALLFSPSSGLSFQIAGALHRLGRRMVGIFSSDDELKFTLKHVPMQGFLEGTWLAERRAQSSLAPTQIFNSAVVVAEGLYRAPKNKVHMLESLHAQLRLAQEAVADVQIVAVIPDNTLSESEMKELRSAAPQMVLLLCPQLFGFHDDNLLENTLQVARKMPYILNRRCPSQEDESKFVFSGDVAANVASAILNFTRIQGETVRLQATFSHLEEFRQAAQSALTQKSSALQRIRSIADRRHLGDLISITPKLESPTPARSAVELFPDAPTRIVRALTAAQREIETAPERQLHHPPGRGP